MGPAAGAAPGPPLRARPAREETGTAGDKRGQPGIPSRCPRERRSGTPGEVREGAPGMGEQRGAARSEQVLAGHRARREGDDYSYRFTIKYLNVNTRYSASK